MERILDFCGGCGILLEEGVGALPEADQICANCGLVVTDPIYRIPGVFQEEAATQLRKAMGQL